MNGKCCSLLRIWPFGALKQHKILNENKKMVWPRTNQAKGKIFIWTVLFFRNRWNIKVWITFYINGLGTHTNGIRDANYFIKTSTIIKKSITWIRLESIGIRNVNNRALRISNLIKCIVLQSSHYETNIYRKNEWYLIKPLSAWVYPHISHTHDVHLYTDTSCFIKKFHCSHLDCDTSYKQDIDMSNTMHTFLKAVFTRQNLLPGRTYSPTAQGLI